jgi:DNA polymerase-3 subunit epsilon
MSTRFLAIDFETANFNSDSACAIGLVRVESNRITSKRHFWIRPPEKKFSFTHIHGITWDQVENAPTFEDLWPELQPWFKDIDFIAAHNVGFDRKVLLACCARYQISLPELRYQCTVQLARKQLGLKPANLPSVCRALNIPLSHHDALSDAIACAQIAIAAYCKKPQ